MWPSFVTLVLALIGILMGGCLIGVFFVGAGGASPATLMAQPGFLISAAAVSQLSLLLAVWKLPGLFGDVGAAGWHERVRWRPERFHLVEILVTALGTQAIGALALSLLSFTAVSDGVLANMGDVARTTEPSGFAWLLLFGALAPGFAEELSFRGLLQTRLVERWGVAMGIVISSVLFGVWHLDLRQGAMALTMGLWLGWCAHRQKTIVNVAFAHALNNGFAFALTRITAREDPDVTGAGLAITLAVAAVCAGVMWWRTEAR